MVVPCKWCCSVHLCSAKGRLQNAMLFCLRILILFKNPNFLFYSFFFKNYERGRGGPISFSKLCLANFVSQTLLHRFCFPKIVSPISFPQTCVFCVNYFLNFLFSLTVISNHFFHQDCVFNMWNLRRMLFFSVVVKWWHTQFGAHPCCCASRFFLHFTQK